MKCTYIQCLQDYFQLFLFQVISSAISTNSGHGHKQFCSSKFQPMLKNKIQTIGRMEEIQVILKWVFRKLMNRVHLEIKWIHILIRQNIKAEFIRHFFRSLVQKFQMNIILLSLYTKGTKNLPALKVIKLFSNLNQEEFFSHSRNYNLRSAYIHMDIYINGYLWKESQLNEEPHFQRDVRKSNQNRFRK